MIKTSVIVPVYNTEGYLQECLGSVFSQTQSEIEIIAIDDGSTDNSLQILKQMKAVYPNLIIITQENHGLGYTRNIGVEFAKGEFVYFIDSDDFLADKDALRKCYDCAKKYETDVLLFDAEIFGNIQGIQGNAYDRTKILNKMETMSGLDFINQYYERTYCPSACLLYLRKDFLIKNRIKFPEGIYYEDNTFFCEAMLWARKVMYFPEFLYRRRYRGASITQSSFDLYRAKSLLKVVRDINGLRENKNDGSRTIFRKIACMHLRDMVGRCEEAGLLHEIELSNGIFKVLQSVCRKNTYKMEDYILLETMHYVLERIPSESVSRDDKARIKEERKYFLMELFETLPLNKLDKQVGIYGMGKYAERFLSDYESCYEIKANLVFIDSYIPSLTEKYRGFNIYNVSDIGSLRFECIIIASIKYECEMYEKLLDVYGQKFKVFCLGKDWSRDGISVNC